MRIGKRPAICHLRRAYIGSSKRIVELFFQLIEDGKTMIMVTHDQEIAHRTPRTIEIVDGQIVHEEDGMRITI